MTGNKKTILIIGINGFLGSHLSKLLIDEYNVIGLEYSIENLFRLKDYSFKVYSSKDELKKIFDENRIYAIIHAATIYRRSVNEPIDILLETNILMPAKLYELANLYNVDIFINSDSFFNDSRYKYNYLADYTLSKRHALDWLKLMCNKCKLINMKMFHMFGPHDSPTKFFPNIISQLNSNVPNIDVSPGEQKRDFIYIDDVVSAYKAVLDKRDLLIDPFHEFEVGTGNTISIRDLILLIKKVTKSKSKINFGALSYRTNEIMESRADNQTLCNLGWSPKVTIKDGIEKLICE
jgi:CDP-paratose synthetase